MIASKTSSQDAFSSRFGSFAHCAIHTPKDTSDTSMGVRAQLGGDLLIDVVAETLITGLNFVEDIAFTLKTFKLYFLWETTHLTVRSISSSKSATLRPLLSLQAPSACFIISIKLSALATIFFISFESFRMTRSRLKNLWSLVSVYNYKSLTSMTFWHRSPRLPNAGPAETRATAWK